MFLKRSSLRNFFSSFELFPAEPILRIEEDTAYSSLFTGVLSFVAMAGFLYILVNKIIDIVTYGEISSVQTQSKLNPDQVFADDIFFAINIQFLEIAQMNKYFQFELIRYNSEDSSASIPLQECSVEDWQMLNTNVTEIYTSARLERFLCPSNRSELDLREADLYSQSENGQKLILNVYFCTKTDNPSCITDSQARERFLSQQSSNNGVLFANIYFLDQNLVPQEREPIKYTLNRENSISFSSGYGSLSVFYIGTYETTTDIQFLPFQTQERVKGNYLANVYSGVIGRSEFDSSPLVQIVLVMSTRIIYMERSVGKLDEAISYVGGLLSSIVVFLGLIFLSYNQYLFQLAVAKKIYNYDKTGKTIGAEDLNLFKYLVYSIYQIIPQRLKSKCDRSQGPEAQKLPSNEGDSSNKSLWVQIAAIDKTLEEVNKQMDVRLLFKKLQFLQSCTQYLLADRNKKDLIALSEPRSIDQIARNRQVIQYYHQVIGGQKGVNLEDFIKERVEAHKAKYKRADQEQGLVNSESILMEILNIVTNDRFDLAGAKIGFKKLLKESQKVQGYANVEKEVRNISIHKDFQQIQRELAESLTNMMEDDDKKNTEFLDTVGIKIPLKVVHRLLYVANKTTSASRSSSNQGRNLVSSQNLV